MAGWIKMPLGTKVGLGPGHIVLDGDPVPPSPEKRGHSRPIFVPCVLWSNSWIDQDATWYGGRPRPRPHCVRWGPSSPSQKRDTAAEFSAHVYCCQTVAHLSYCWALVLINLQQTTWSLYLLKDIGIMPSEVQHRYICHYQRQLRHVSLNAIIIVTNV